MSLFETGNRRLTVLLDIRGPLAYLALHPAAEFAVECGIEIDFLPVADSPLKPPSEPLPDDDRGVRHRRHRAHAIAREIEIYAGARGLVLDDYYRSPDPTAFHVAWLWMRERHEDLLVSFLVEAFRAYWALELDPSNREDVARLVESFDANAQAAGFREWNREQGPERADRLSEELVERGLTRAPTYLIEDEVFVGRQHLPMIRWILGGRAGPGPI